MNESWQDEYAREFERVNGFGVSLEALGGGWWTMRYLDTGCASHLRLRRKQVEALTRRLNTCRSYNPIDYGDPF